MIINNSLVLPVLGLFILACLIYANSRLVNETIEWMEKEERLSKEKKYLKYGLLVIVRTVCMVLFINTSKQVSDAIKAWRENGKITF